MCWHLYLSKVIWRPRAEKHHQVIDKKKRAFASSSEICECTERFFQHMREKWIMSTSKFPKVVHGWDGTAVSATQHVININFETCSLMHMRAAVIKAILVVMLERNSFIVVLENQQIYAASEVWAPELYNTTAVVLTLLHLEKHLSTIRLLFKPCIMYIQPSIFIPLSLMLNSTAFSVQNWPNIAAAFTSFYSTKCLGALWLQCMPCTCDFLGSATWLYQMQLSTSVFKRKKQMCFEFTYMNFQRRII